MRASLAPGLAVAAVLAVLMPGMPRAGLAQAQQRAQAQPPQSALEGVWRVEKILTVSGQACWDRSRASTLLGSSLRYRPGSLVWKGGSVPVTETLTRTLTARQFEDEYHFGLDAVGIHAPRVIEFDLQHEDADVTGGSTEVPGDTVLLAGPGRIVMSACGVYFAAVRAGR